MEYPKYLALYYYLRKGTYPRDPTEAVKRRLRDQARTSEKVKIMCLPVQDSLACAAFFEFPIAKNPLQDTKLIGPACIGSGRLGKAPEACKGLSRH